MTKEIVLAKDWDGRDYLLLHAGRGFNNFHSLHYSQGIIEGEDYCVLFNDRTKINSELLAKFIKSIKAEKAKQLVEMTEKDLETMK